MRFRQLFCKKMIRADPNRSESEVSKLMAPHDRHRTTIAVVAVPANSGGGLTILRDLHGWAVKHNEYNWIFVVSTPVLAEYPHIRVVNIPWIKRSWIHRLLFDVARSWRIIRNMGADVILSLQNTSILCARTSTRLCSSATTVHTPTLCNHTVTPHVGLPEPRWQTHQTKHRHRRSCCRPVLMDEGIDSEIGAAGLGQSYGGSSPTKHQVRTL